MPRDRRSVSASGLYHVMMRGNGKQLLFEDDSDRTGFLRRMTCVFTEEGVSVLSWCLMDNHVHILVEDPSEGLSVALHRLGTSYARYFNAKTGHVGHVFQDRFLSSPIEDEAYLLEAVRYIHRNPTEAGICRPDEYIWSSYRELVPYDALGLEWASFPVTPPLCVSDRDRVLSLFDSAKQLAEFIDTVPVRPYRLRAGKRIPDDEMVAIAAEVVRECFGSSASASKIKAMPLEQRGTCLQALQDRGFSVRQIIRITGMGRWSIERATAAAARCRNE